MTHQYTTSLKQYHSKVYDYDSMQQTFQAFQKSIPSIPCNKHSKQQTLLELINFSAEPVE
jgi:hypothetical protein